MKNDSSSDIFTTPDIALIGGGIMSATLGIFLKKLRPELTIQIVEALPKVALESSHASNNAGTGHAALCELNYTTEDADGNVDISQAIRINTQFETSKHFWAHLVEQEIITSPSSFISRVAHMSFVRGEDNQAFLKRRHSAMQGHFLFEEMQYTTNHDEVASWTPLLLQGRESDEPIAATRIDRGTDVNYEALTRHLIDHLVEQDDVHLATDTKVVDLNKTKDGRWQLKLCSTEAGPQTITAGFVFIGAGGAALPLLQKSGIPEGKGYGGFPVSGKFLICKDQTIVDQHEAKVYGKAAVGAPPMSVPHLDTRFINGNRTLLFGPFAGFSPKFLKQGSNLDLFKSVRLDNIPPMLAAGRDNMSLTFYLINECTKSHQDRCDNLREFFPDAVNEEWSLMTAGQRVQIIKKDEKRTGRLQFGTEVVSSSDGSLAAVLGASPGASTAVSIILDVLNQCFEQEMASEDWKATLAEMVPAYGNNLADDRELYYNLRINADDLLQIGVTKK